MLKSGTVAIKTYIKGSYFGDFEIFRNCPRMFTTRAHEKTTLLLMHQESLRLMFEKYPECHYAIMKRTLIRYLKYKLSRKKAEEFEKISMKDPFWKIKPEDSQNLFHERVVSWVNSISNPQLNVSIAMPE